MSARSTSRGSYPSWNRAWSEAEMHRTAQATITPGAISSGGYG